MNLRQSGPILIMLFVGVDLFADSNLVVSVQTQKENLIAQLPVGTLKVLDQSYVDGARPGSKPDSVQSLDLYVPSGKGPFPLILWIHGGGWHEGDKELGGASLALQFVPAGFALASLDYRFTYDAPFPAQIEDCNAALVWLRKHAKEYHLDPNRVGAVGHSAGAHLAALMAVTGDGKQFSKNWKTSVRVQAAVCWSGPFDLDRERGNWPTNMFAWNPRDPFCKTFFPGEKYDEAFARKSSPASYIHIGTPPMLIVNGGKDMVVPLGQAVAFANELKQAGADVTFRIDPDRGHDVMNDAATKEAIQFLERTLGPVRTNDSGLLKSRDEVVRLQIEPQTVLASIPNDFIGFGYETSATARDGFFSVTNTHMINLFRTLSPCGLIRIGGNVSDHTKFDPQGPLAVCSERETSRINQKALESLGEFLRTVGWKAMWGLNLGTGSKEEAAQEALAVHAALGDRLQSLEIGNEVDLLPRFKKSYTNYFAAYQEYKSAIRQALPDATFSGPDVAVNTQWTMDFAGTESKDMKMLTQHFYRSGAMKPDATIETLLATDAKWDNTLQQLQQTCVEKGLAYRINEENSFYGGGKPGVSDTFASALWCLDYMFLLASHGCVGVNMETDINQLAWVSHYSPIFRDATGQLTARPEYYGMLAFAVAGKGNLVKVTAIQTNINLSAYATKNDEGQIWLTLVNKDLSKDASVEITMPKSLVMAESYRLAAPSATSRDHVTFAGAEVSPEGLWSPVVTEKVTVKAGTVYLKLPAISAVVVQLR